MSKTTIFSLLVLAGVFILLAGREFSRKTGEHSQPDGCMSCHEPQQDPSPSHPVSVLGCSGCHLGNPFARKKSRAHLGLAPNPGNLRLVRLTCGKHGCHLELPDRVEKSLMATNRGILAALQSRWPHDPAESVRDVNELLSRPPGRSMALDHYRKMCGGCHLWKPRHPSGGEIGRRGGGCTDCHILELSGSPQDLTKTAFRHPQLTTRIPNENCLKCHNRSARVGLSYQGRFESEGYGTPFERRKHNGRRLTGGRFYIELQPDVHHLKAGLDCIDCHTERGIMGDGNTYARMEEQVDVTCNSCHDPQFRRLGPQEELADRLRKLNGCQPPPDSPEGVLSPKGSPLYNIKAGDGDEIKVYRKRDGKPFPTQRLGHSEIHRAPFHDRLTCQACHSAWMPQCYGCHVALLKGEDQRDWLTGDKLRGRWVEGRSYLRFLRPPLGIWPNGQIGPFAPGCQVFLDVFDENGHHQPEHSHQSLVMASFDPHTTALSAPRCSACHMDPRVLGLGAGSLKITSKGLHFTPLYDSQASGLGITFPLDAFVSADGEPLQSASREAARPFNKEELRRITRVAQCLPCHDTYNDPIYREYDRSLRRFRSGEARCNGGLP